MKERLIKFGKDTFKFLTSLVFLKNFAIAVVGLFLFSILVFEGLKLYTCPNCVYTVPNFEGYTLDQIKKTKVKHLTLVVNDSTYNPDQKPLAILSQEPPAKSKVKKGRKIYLTINTAQPPLTRIPRIWGKQLTFSEKQLASLDLQVGKITERPDKAVGTILEVRYKGKELFDYDSPDEAPRVPRGSKLDLVVASGIGNIINIPDLVCQPFSAASVMLSANQLSYTILPIDGGFADTLNLFVTEQYPPYSPMGTISIGDEVTLRLSPTPPLNCSVDSDFIINEPTEPTQDTTVIEISEEEEEDEF